MDNPVHPTNISPKSWSVNAVLATAERALRPQLEAQSQFERLFNQGGQEVSLGNRDCGAGFEPGRGALPLGLASSSKKTGTGNVIQIVK